ncbi:UvrB/UvrC motif-containing protein [Novosphingobium aquimarinum]|uniref:UvrB/UvrC motif-containing protein n=1 Tax=Novosphingobium aquimarinum TaxID=2682494 RepID=UPI0012EC15BE|nr:UvrB/UvrC motif-containing protein [Novosphingobium aquimarinum]
MTAIDELRLAMERAAAAMDFEEASRLRDQISVLRLANDQAEVEEIDTAGLTRQQPGAMGLGTSQQTIRPPAGWVRPKKPDPLTAHRSRRPGKKR